MSKHFLVTVSNDADHLYGVRFICSFLNGAADDLVTLLHICRLDGDDMNKALTEMWLSPGDRSECKLTGGLKKALDTAHALLRRGNFAVDQTLTKTAVERYGKVKDILTEGSRGYYDAIVLGRRATYALQWMFERPAEEMAHAMVRDHCCDVPLWICPEVEAGRKNVLLCVDGSDSAFRAVDHVGYILASQKQHGITLFHVKTGAGAAADEIFARAETILDEHAIGKDRISRNTAWGVTVAGAIQTESDRGGYAAVALGMRSGRDKGMLDNFIQAGGTTVKLISKIEKAALWCCP